MQAIFPRNQQSRPKGTKELGQEGEGLAERLLKARGYKILARNYRCRLGEVDLIAEKGETISFIEVKTRRATDKVSPRELISHGKQVHLSKVAHHYLACEKKEDCNANFIVVIIDWSQSLRSQGSSQFEIIEDAFEAQWGY